MYYRLRDYLQLCCSWRPTRKPSPRSLDYIQPEIVRGARYLERSVQTSGQTFNRILNRSNEVCVFYLRPQCLSLTLLSPVPLCHLRSCPDPHLTYVSTSSARSSNSSQHLCTVCVCVSRIHLLSSQTFATVSLRSPLPCTARLVSR